jgi:hypothetical protein
MRNQLNDIEKYGQTARGMKELIKHLSGERLTFKEAIHAKCYDCSGYYSDGKVDCKMPDCPSYGFMPYRTVKPAKRILSDDERAVLQDRIQKGRLKKVQITPSFAVAP